MVSLDLGSYMYMYLLIWLNFSFILFEHQLIKFSYCKSQSSVCINVQVLMRDEKEGRKKQARSNKQQGKATQHTQGSHFS